MSVNLSKVVSPDDYFTKWFEIYEKNKQKAIEEGRWIPWGLDTNRDVEHQTDRETDEYFIKKYGLK